MFSLNMKMDCDIVLIYLRELEEENGGYYGTDLSILAKGLGITQRGLKRKLAKWLKENKASSELHYLGKHKPSITLNESMDIRRRIASNPLKVKSHIYSDINEMRKASGKKSIAKSTFYRAT